MIYEFWEKISAKIKKIQGSPEKEKKRIVLVLAIVIFALTVGLWLGFAEDFKISASGGKNPRQSYPLNDSLEKLIKEFKSNVENKIKQFPVWKLEK